MSQESEQLKLDIPVRPKREVGWLCVEEVTRLKLFGKKIVTKFVPKGPSLTLGSIDAERISELQDPDLRYALRFADAAQEIGWKEDGECSLSKHAVFINAVGSDIESHLVSAQYTGRVLDGRDEFLENLRSADPHLHENQ